jgi:hypothetical protein
MEFVSRTLIVSYDLVNPGQNYEALLKRLKNYPQWARLGGSAYLILTNQTPVQVRDDLAAVLDSNDKIFVGTAPSPSAWQGMPEEVSRWIIANQR